MRSRRGGSYPDLFGRQLDHEACAGLTVAAVLDRGVAAVQAHVLVDERQPETSTVARTAPAGDRATGKALEDEVALLEWDPCSVVFNGDPHVPERFALVLGLGHDHLWLAAAVQAGVVDQVGDDT